MAKKYFLYDEQGNPSDKSYTIDELADMKLTGEHYVCPELGSPTQIKSIPELKQLIWQPPKVIVDKPWQPPKIGEKSVEINNIENMVHSPNYLIKRIAAHFIDSIILYIIFIILIELMGEGMLIISIGDFLDYHLSIVMVLFYYIVSESTTQATLGKHVMKLKICMADGQEINVGTAILRNLGKIVSVLILMIGFMMIFWDKKRQGLHDKIANTLVINK